MYSTACELKEEEYKKIRLVNWQSKKSEDSAHELEKEVLEDSEDSDCQQAEKEYQKIL